MQKNIHIMSRNSAKTLVWKHEYDVKLWRPKQRTPNTNDHHMPLNENLPMKIFCVRHCAALWWNGDCTGKIYGKSIPNFVSVAEHRSRSDSCWQHQTLTNHIQQTLRISYNYNRQMSSLWVQWLINYQITHFFQTIVVLAKEWDREQHIFRQCFQTFLGSRHPTEEIINLRHPVAKPQQFAERPDVISKMYFLITY